MPSPENPCAAAAYYECGIIPAAPLPTPGSTPSPALDGGDKLTSLSAKNPNTHQSDTRTHVAVVSCHAAPKYGVARGFIHSGP